MWPVVNFKYSMGDIYVGRPSIWKNPFKIGIDGTRDEVILLFEGYLQSHPEIIESALKELKNKILICWCAPQKCHGDVLARIANGWQLAIPLEYFNNQNE